MRVQICPKCKGKRLREESLAVTIDNVSIADYVSMDMLELRALISQLPEKFTPREKKIADQIFREIKRRLEHVLEIGLGYLTLNRTIASLSGGESQRIRLATQIGSYLTGVVYILDEPSIGLHQRDVGKLIDTLKHLRDLGNTVIVVEHEFSGQCY